MAKRASWTSRIAFYVVAIGAACGLGNLWRFPYVVGENGGGAFVLLYLFLVLVIGVPILIGELMLGKYTGRSLLTATHSLPVKYPRAAKMIGRIAVILSLLVLSYYTLVSGWVLHFAIQFLSTALGFREPGEISGLSGLLKNGGLQVSLASVHLLFCIIIVLQGVHEGLEKFVGWTVPLFFTLLVILVGRSLSLPTAPHALRFLFYPDFSKLTLSSLGQALGQVLFTLSLGFGTMVTFGSYLVDEHIPTASFRLATIDTAISLISALLIFPIALQASNLGTDMPMADPGLLFEVLPKFLLEMSGGGLFGFAFFVFLYLAALGASIGLMEVVVSNWVDRTKIGRAKASWITGGISWILCCVPAFSGSIMQSKNAGSSGILENVDSMIINWVLPLIALGIALVASYGIAQQEQEKLFISADKIESVALYSHWRWVQRWGVVIIIGGGILLQVLRLII